MQTLPKLNTNILNIYVRPEIQLLLYCASTKRDAAKTEQIKSLIQLPNLDWEDVISQAYKHGLVPLLYTNLNTICKDDIPKEAINQIRHLSYTNSQRNLVLCAELFKILHLLQEKDIKGVPYKGPILASTVYGNIALRPSGDLDIIVQQQHVLEFKKILISLGYQPLVELTQREEIAFLEAKSEHSYNFFHDEKKILVEIHWRVSPEYTSPIETKHFWSKLKPFPFAGITIYNLPLEDWLPILCVHGSRHRWERLIWLCDIAELLRTNPEVNWDYLIQVTTELDCKRMFFLGLFLAHHLLDVTLPVKVLRQIKADTEVVALSSEICQSLFTKDNHNPKFLGRTIFHMRVRERWQNKFLYFQSFLRWLMIVRK
ncbi:hypothetical protein CEN41_14660 [Fischerella thermalis CCMEE 5330]|uniref:Nucleotidyltransferase family protein n=1 Tax=Fischerella thermalis CCMEE 5330 TaxID=2019670 RepID=A0A2N6M7F5_9CYAN|nr:nucleotidyltransferase family protein [Fischerella thermalis]PMB42709.1 hypothetical protein CEN41_14660 [Fischerella thermalis CCMEE 5330]